MENVYTENIKNVYAEEMKNVHAENMEKRMRNVLEYGMINYKVQKAAQPDAVFQEKTVQPDVMLQGEFYGR